MLSYDEYFSDKHNYVNTRIGRHLSDEEQKFFKDKLTELGFEVSKEEGKFFNASALYNSEHFCIDFDLQYRKSKDWKDEFYIFQLKIVAKEDLEQELLEMMNFDEERYHSTFKKLEEFDSKAIPFIKSIIDKTKELDQEYKDIENLDNLNLL